MNYTRQQILDLPAGRELDTLIERHVYNQEAEDGFRIWRWSSDDGTQRRVSRTRIADFSCSMTDAWMLFKHLARNGHSPSLDVTTYPTGTLAYRCGAIPRPGVDAVSVTAEDAPLAIVKCALLLALSR